MKMKIARVSRDALRSLVYILIEQNPAHLFVNFIFTFINICLLQYFFANFSFPFGSRPCEKPWWIWGQPSCSPNRSSKMLCMSMKHKRRNASSGSLLPCFYTFFVHFFRIICVKTWSSAADSVNLKKEQLVGKKLKDFYCWLLVSKQIKCITSTVCIVLCSLDVIVMEDGADRCWRHMATGSGYSRAPPQDHSVSGEACRLFYIRMKSFSYSDGGPAEPLLG